MSLSSSVCMNVLSLRAWKNCYLTCWEPYWMQLVSCRLVWEALLGFIWEERQSLSSFGYCFERFPGIWKSSSLWCWHFCWLEKFQWPGTLSLGHLLKRFQWDSALQRLQCEALGGHGLSVRPLAPSSPLPPPAYPISSLLKEPSQPPHH